MAVISNRVLLSLDGKCTFGCKHCYTHELGQNPKRKISEVVETISDNIFDVVYISQKNENFADPTLGVELCEQVFRRYKCNIMIITRNVFDQKIIDRLVNLQSEMKNFNKMLFFGVSVIGMESASISENLGTTPQTIDRLDFIKQLHQYGINTLLLIRPLFPEKLIPGTEIERIIDYIDGKVSCVLTGPLMVNEHILNRLALNENDLNYVKGGESEYLDGAIKSTMKFVDVLQEIGHLKRYCVKKGLPFFEHSMPALNYLYKLNN